jgi:hypothetical protein
MTQLANAFDTGDQFVARCEEDLRFASNPDSGWSTGEDDIARLEAHDSRQLGNKGRH